MTAPDPQNIAAAVQEARERRRALLQHPTEIPGVDYKSAVALGNNEFSHKLIKQIIAFANGGGGTLIIGYKEDQSKRLQPDPDMTPEIAASYDTSKLSKAVNDSVRGETPIPITVYQEPEAGVTYPMIEVEPFKTAPFFCRVDKFDAQGKPILKQGTLYIRTARSTSEELATPEDWERLLDLAVTQRQDALLGRFGALLRQFGLNMQPQSANRSEIKERFEAWIKQEREKAEQLAQEGNRTVLGYYLFAYRPEQLPTKLENDNSLLEAAQAAKRPNTGWPIGLIPFNFWNEHDRYQATDDGLEVVIGQHDTDHFDYWRLDRKGGFFIFRNLMEDVPRFTPIVPGQMLRASTVVWRIAEAIDHCIALNRAMGTSNTTPIWFAAEYGGIQGRQLSDEQRLIFAAPASRDRVRFEREFTLDQLVADADGIVADAVKQILSVFGFFKPPEDFIQSELQQYRQSDTRRMY